MIVWSPRQKEIIKYVAKRDPVHLILEGAVRSGKMVGAYCEVCGCRG
jgi:hypothetical protein